MHRLHSSCAEQMGRELIDESRLYRAVGERLRRLREAKDGPHGKLTQAALAREIGLERTSITNIEQGNQKLPLHVLYRICEVLEVHVGDVMPPVIQIRATSEPPPVEELTFGGQVVRTTPLLARRLSQILKAE